MATTLSNIQISLLMKALLSDTVQGGEVKGEGGANITFNYTSGTSANQANRLIQNTDRSLSDTATEDLDLYDLAGFDSTSDLVGTTVTFAEIVGLLIRNDSTSTGNLLVGGKGDSTAWTSMLANNSDIITLLPGAAIALAVGSDPGYVVTDTTNHILKMAASGGDLTYDIYILGRNA